MHKKAFIYLARQGCSDLYKIGSSFNPESRLKQLQTANGEKLELILIFETKFKFGLESSLHRRFANYKTLGEWFQLPEKEVKDFFNICQIQETHFTTLEEQNTYIQDKLIKGKKWF